MSLFSRLFNNPSIDPRLIPPSVGLGGMQKSGADPRSGRRHRSWSEMEEELRQRNLARVRHRNEMAKARAELEQIERDRQSKKALERAPASSSTSMPAPPPLIAAPTASPASTAPAIDKSNWINDPRNPYSDAYKQRINTEYKSLKQKFDAVNKPKTVAPAAKPAVAAPSATVTTPSQAGSVAGKLDAALSGNKGFKKDSDDFAAGKLNDEQFGWLHESAMSEALGSIGVKSTQDMQNALDEIARTSPLGYSDPRANALRRIIGRRTGQIPGISSVVGNLNPPPDSAPVSSTKGTPTFGIGRKNPSSIYSF